MALIELETVINAPVERCFNLSLSPKLHVISTEETGEKIVKGRKEGLFEVNDEVTWSAKHFGIWQELTVKITEMRFPYFFSDEMIKGNFKKMKHEHFFKNEDEKTIMKDIFLFESPFGIAGRIFNKVFLRNYMKKFLIIRNNVIKDFAESEKWKKVLN